MPLLQSDRICEFATKVVKKCDYKNKSLIIYIKN